jgi:hypothetical protein
MNKEEMITKHMKTLGITREEAIQLIADDEEIDRMTRTSDIDGDLTAEQRKSAKKARQADRKPTVYKFDTTKRKRAENTGKRFLIDEIKKCLENAGADNLEVTNPEREIVFMSEGTKYKIVLSAPRK